MVPALRDYQQEAIERLRQALRSCPRRSVVLAAPTGSGKTTIAAEMVRAAISRGHRVLWVVHRRELIEQAAARMAEFGLTAGIVMAGHRPTESPLQVASIQTLVRRLVPEASLIVIDEAHHAVSRSYEKVLERKAEGAFLVGLTATPYRLDGKGLGKLFDGIVQVASPQQLVEAGWLVPARVWSHPCDVSGLRVRAGDYRPDDLASLMDQKPHLVGDVVATWKRHAEGLPTVAYGVGVRHSLSLSRAFEAAGVPAAHIDGMTPKAERADALESLRDGRIRVLSNCEILTEGVDVPHLGAIVLARPTKSRALYLQMVGRGLRPAPGKDHAIILDHAGCWLEHGDPLEEIPYSLGGVASGEAHARVRQARICGQCYLACPPATRKCPSCGHEFPVLSRKVDERGGELVRREGQPSKLRPPPDAIAYLARLQDTARVRGYKPGWVSYRFRARVGRWPSRVEEEMAKRKRGWV